MKKIHVYLNFTLYFWTLVATLLLLSTLLLNRIGITSPRAVTMVVFTLHLLNFQSATSIYLSRPAWVEAESKPHVKSPVV